MHDTLRLRFARADGGWRQFYDGPGEPPRLERLDLTGEADPDSLLNAVTAGVLNLSVKDSPGLTIVTDEGDEWVVGDGSLRVEGDREGILDWLSRGRTEGIYLPEGVDEAPELPAW